MPGYTFNLKLHVAKILVFYLCTFCLLLIGCKPVAKNKQASPHADRHLLNDSARQAAPADTLLRLVGTEPFWGGILSATSFHFQSPEEQLPLAIESTETAAGRPADYVRLFQLKGGNWLLIRQGDCSDGMSDQSYPYQATLWLQGRLYEGCAR
jgi:uncharacterized membrane protein